MATIVNDGILLEYIVSARFLQLNELIEISIVKCYGLAKRNCGKVK